MKFTFTLLTLLIGLNTSFVLANDFQSISLEDQLKTSVTENVQIELFVMSYCPFAQEAQKSLIPILQKYDSKVSLKVNFVAYINELGDIASLNGDEEVAEDFRQFIISKTYPTKYLDYLKLRLENQYQAEWETISSSLGMNIESINTLFHNEKAWNVFKEHILSINKKGIYSSPYILVNGERYTALSNGKFYNSEYIKNAVAKEAINPSMVVVDCSSAADGTTCADTDGTVCSGARCMAGVCDQLAFLASTSTQCEDTDGNDCQSPRCDGAGACNQNGFTASDGTSCGTDLECQGGMCNSTLPLDLLTFSVVKYEASLKLIWLTANEINTSHFDIERSADGQEWEIIGQLDANGWSLEERQYDFMDEKPLAGVNYYRLRMVDLDERFEYSPTKVIQYESLGSVNAVIQPNPNQGIFDLKVFSIHPKEMKVRIFDATGRVVYNQIYQQKMDVIQENIDLLKATPGIYLLKIDYEGGSLTHKFIIQ